MRILSSVMLLLFLVLGCNKDKQPVIPYVPVSLQLYPNSLDYIPVGGYLYKEKYGYRGILIFQSLPGEFMVYECCCPYDPEKTGARVSVEPGGTTCVDSVCKSKFILYNGTPFEGPSPYSLMQYQHTYDGEVLYIYN
ncbi:MAG: hypothetical protein WCI92_11535 [Bacteroidota bacterium]